MEEAETQTEKVTETETETEKKVVGLLIERALVPEWYERVLEVAAPWCIRMYTIEKPDEYVVQIELYVDKVEDFHTDLAAAWAEYADAQKAAGTWVEE